MSLAYQRLDITLNWLVTVPDWFVLNRTCHTSRYSPMGKAPSSRNTLTL